MSALLCKSPAKINLFLRVVGRRPDGYHDIETLFQSIDLCDQLRFERSDAPGVALTCDGVFGEVIPHDEQNLVVQTWQRVAEAAGVSESGVCITLEKNIPPQGGLGGGSSNAATTLDAALRLLEVDLSQQQVSEIAVELGADVPFFLCGSPCAGGTGIGDELTPVSHNAAFHAVLVFPEFGISTPEVFRRYDLENEPEPSDSETSDSEVGDSAQTCERLIDALQHADITATREAMFNELETPAFALEPRLGELWQDLEEIAEMPVRMSGSGSTLFTLASDAAQARDLAQLWQEHTNLFCTSAAFSKSYHRPEFP